MTVQDIKSLPTGEKLRFMEALWDDLRDHYDAAEVPEEVIALLHERQARVSRGESALLDWDQVKSMLGRG
jgi:hypothetical protein